MRKEVRDVKPEIEGIIPMIFAEMESDGENQSEELLQWYKACTTAERSTVNTVMIYLCGWSFETILEKCGISVDEKGNPVLG